MKIVKNKKSELFYIIVLTWFGVVTTYLLFVNLVPYLVNTMHYKTSNALILNAFATTVLVAVIPFAGRLADRVGRTKIMTWSIISLSIIIIPYLYIVSTPHYVLIVFLQITITIPAAFYFATVPVYLVELVQSSIRYRTVSLGYNISAAIFGGTTPLITLFLAQKTKLSYMPGFYLILCAIITLQVLKNNKNHPSISE